MAIEKVVGVGMNRTQQGGNADTLGGYHLSEILEAIYPVGSVYIGSDDGTMPALIASIGTWVRLEGRVIVGVSDSDSDFGYDDTGGEKTHTLTIAEMPTHRHRIVAHAAAANNSGPAARSLSGAGIYRALAGDVQMHADSITYEGGDGAHNNLQPFKAKYMWERTA